MSRDVRPPIHLSTTFEHDPDFQSKKSHISSRGSKPHRDHLEERLAALKIGKAVLCFASGLAASKVVFHSLNKGDHLLIPHQCYWGTRQQIHKIFIPIGIEVDEVDMREIGLVASKIKSNNKMIFVEKPSNPLLYLADIEAISNLIEGTSTLLVWDNTEVTGEVLKPLLLGAHLVVISASKAINGHSDAIGGAVIVKKRGEIYNRLKDIQVFGRIISSPHDCWLISRGLVTLQIRLERQIDTVEKMVSFFRDHDRIKDVFYPFDTHHPQLHLAKKQMKCGSSLLSIVLQDGLSASTCLKRLKRIPHATSLGGVETLAEQRASVEQGQSKISQSVIKNSLGVENPKLLQEEFFHALNF